jgi:zinc/manganese transport system substrate-binding protein
MIPSNGRKAPLVSRSTGTAIATLGLVATLSACTGDDASGGPATSSGDAAACPGEVVDVVVTVGQWSDIVRSLGGDCANVTTVVPSGSVDPHDFDPGTADLAAFSGAELVVLNGADYDHWAENALAGLDPEPPVVSAAEVAGMAERGDPHLWHDPQVVEDTAAAITAAFVAASPDAEEHFADRASSWQADLQPYRDAVAGLRAAAEGRSYAATESIYDRMAAAVGLTDRTPEGFRVAASNEGEPAPGDLAAFEAVLTDGTVDVLIFNRQTSGSVPEQLRGVAEEAGVPVVEVSESPPSPDSSFLAWQVDQLEALSDALTRTP